MKKYFDHGKLIKKKKTFNWAAKFYRFSPLSSQRGTWQHIGTGELAKRSISKLAGNRKMERDTELALGF